MRQAYFTYGLTLEERLVWLGAGDIAEEAKTRHPRMMRRA